MTRAAAVLLVALTLTACTSSGGAGPAADVRSGRIEVAHAEGQQALAGWSLDEAAPVPAERAEAADLVLYFDDNDCPDGAIFGHDDVPLIHVLGKKSWEELGLVKAVPGEDPVTMVTPTADQVGVALLVQRRDGSHALVRLTEVVAATTAELKAGKRAAIAFEWAPFKPGS